MDEEAARSLQATKTKVLSLTTNVGVTAFPLEPILALRSEPWEAMMNLVTRAAVLVGLSCGLSLSGFAQKATRPVNVSITCTCDDAMGRAYLSALHQALAHSTRFKEVRADLNGDDRVLRINIVSMPLEAQVDRPQAALSIVCLHEGALLHQFVETCTHIPIADCAASMLQDLERWDSA